MGFFANSLVQAAIEHTKESTDELLRLLITEGPCLPSTSTCFKKEFFDRFGVFDEAYTLIEDYPMHMRLAEEGWIIHYNNFVARRQLLTPPREGCTGNRGKECLKRAKC